MKTSRILLGVISAFAVCSFFASCETDESKNETIYPNAIVTIKPINDGAGFNVWVDDKVQGPASNITKSPYGKKEVRAIANIRQEKDEKGMNKIYINWMDSIRTKNAIMPELKAMDWKKYGEDRLEIINGFGTVVEDGYLTLRYSTAITNPKAKRDMNLIVQHSEKEPYKLVLAYNAHGDNKGRFASGLIAFRLSEIDKIARKNGKKDVTLQLHWKSYQGDKQASFKYHVRSDTE
ncbi:NigD-like C-terminal domain-containing protein [Prevotella sp. HUN102]|uniref:NigD1/NigD2 family lipoprotein n=1 Tax=Prevotella sp. HUN102 TaxID=1392486 RepID=UPI00049015DF|nr:NigD-like C-terminal domain-containing protein [Prevotella sp. HUN102]